MKTEDWENSLIINYVESVMQDIYVVLIINLIIWTGIFSYQMKLNSEIKRLKEQLNETEKN